jgi:hypothetical protein
LSKTILSIPIMAKELEDLFQQRFMNPESKYQKESIIDCTDCFDTMIKAYDSETETEPDPTVKTVIINGWDRRRGGVLAFNE